MAPRFDLAEQIAMLGADSLLPPDSPPLAIGQIWHENDPRQDRNVVILAVAFVGGARYARIATVAPDGSVSRRKTFADVARFGETARGKYSYVKG